MTAPEVLQAYREKYKAFPDLVERIVGQFDWEWFGLSEEIFIANFCGWRFTTEGYDFWGKLDSLDRQGLLTRETIDAAYKEFNINPQP